MNNAKRTTMTHVKGNSTITVSIGPVSEDDAIVVTPQGTVATISPNGNCACLTGSVYSGMSSGAVTLDGAAYMVLSVPVDSRIVHRGTSYSLTPGTCTVSVTRQSGPNTIHVRFGSDGPFVPLRALPIYGQ